MAGNRRRTRRVVASNTGPGIPAQKEEVMTIRRIRELLVLGALLLLPFGLGALLVLSVLHLLAVIGQLL
jgi:hypothetical protein